MSKLNESTTNTCIAAATMHSHELVIVVKIESKEKIRKL